MKFYKALELIEAGEKIARTCWHFHSWIGLQKVDHTSSMSSPYLYIHYELSGHVFPWLPSHPDILSEGWTIVHASDIAKMREEHRAINAFEETDNA